VDLWEDILIVGSFIAKISMVIEFNIVCITELFNHQGEKSFGIMLVVNEVSIVFFYLAFLREILNQLVVLSCSDRAVIDTSYFEPSFENFLIVSLFQFLVRGHFLLLKKLILLDNFNLTFG